MLHQWVDMCFTDGYYVIIGLPLHEEEGGEGRGGEGGEGKGGEGRGRGE